MAWRGSFGYNAWLRLSLWGDTVINQKLRPFA
jgi:hypothetical protein